MKLSNFIPLLFLLYACGSNNQSPASHGRPISNGASNLLEAEKFLQKNLEGWKVADSSDYNPLWWSFYDKSILPYFAVFDLNEDEKADYALIVKSSEINKARLIFLLSHGNSFKHWFAPDFEQNFKGKDLEYGIFIEPPGRIDIAYPTVKSLVLKSNALTLKHFEVSEAIYHWENDSLKVFTMKKSKVD